MPKKTEYRLVVYSYGNIINELVTTNLSEAKKFYKTNCTDNIAIRLFKNGKKILYCDTFKELGFTKYDVLESRRFISSKG